MESDTVATYKSEIVITYSLLYLLATISNEVKDKPKTYIFISISCFCLLPNTEIRPPIISRSVS